MEMSVFFIYVIRLYSFFFWKLDCRDGGFLFCYCKVGMGKAFKLEFYFRFYFLIY